MIHAILQKHLLEPVNTLKLYNIRLIFYNVHQIKYLKMHKHLFGCSLRYTAEKSNKLFVSLLLVKACTLCEAKKSWYLKIHTVKS